MKRSKWRQRLPHGLCDPVLRSWLTEPDSLTARCQRASSSFRVRLLRFAKGVVVKDDWREALSPVKVKEASELIVYGKGA